MQSLAPIMVHAASMVLHVPLELVEVHVSTQRWPKNLRLLKKKKGMLNKFCVTKYLILPSHL